MANKGSFWNSGFGGFLNNMLFGLPSLIAGVIGSSRLTGAEREQNEFNASQAAIDRQFQAQQVEAANQFTAQQTQAQMNFQERMANTQYQRAVADMQAAGVNPALAIGNGGAAAPSGAAGSGVAASGAAAAGSGRGLPFSMSEVMSALKMRKEMALLDAEREKTLADAENIRKSTERSSLEIDWLPRRYASEIGLNEEQTKKVSQEIKNLLQSEAAQKLANDWNPLLWKNELDNGKVNRDSTIVGIQRVLQEIENLRAEKANILEDTRIKQLTQGLVAAQTVLAEQNAREISASAWEKEWSNSFVRLYGHRPDEPVWNAVTSILSHQGSKLREELQHPFGIGKARNESARDAYGSR